ncbi:MAG TPA: HD domain-containing protein [Clostridia bacterium]|nr:HD domain-containing protein [Clostridia bacterium]
MKGNVSKVRNFSISNRIKKEFGQLKRNIKQTYVCPLLMPYVMMPVKGVKAVVEVACQFRDPIHGMIPLNAGELAIVDSEPFQRLRYIRQLGTSYLVYHGAEHTRFGHSIGVMFLVGRAMDVLKEKLPEQIDDWEYERLKQIVKIAALLHDIGHAPFSHVGEEEDGLFPQLQDYDGELDYGHEVYSRLIVQNCFKDVVEQNKYLRELDIDIATVLSFMKGNVLEPKWFFAKELISGQIDMDRMDYLLRDSYYCGVKYGEYDLHRLLDTLTICPSPEGIWQLGIESDGVQAVEGFVFARYWMFIQVYFHKTRRILDYYLVNFLKECLPKGHYPTDVREYLEYTDNHILELMGAKAPRNLWAKRLLRRECLSEVFVSNPHQLMHEEDGFSDYHKLGWIDKVLREKFPINSEPENYYVDQAKTLAAKYQISPSTFLSGETEEESKKLYAIPVKDKHTGTIKPVQDYSLPIKNLSDLKINIIRVYANKEHHVQEDNVTAYEKVKQYMETVDGEWQKHVEEMKDLEKRYKEMQSEKEALSKRFQ